MPRPFTGRLVLLVGALVLAGGPIASRPSDVAASPAAVSSSGTLSMTVIAPSSARRSPPAPSLAAVRQGKAAIAIGDHGTSVRQLQNLMDDVFDARDVQVDGTFGELMRKRLLRFQDHNDLVETGRLNKQTVMRLEATALDKPPVVWQVTPNFSSRGGADIDTIVLHHTATKTAQGAIDLMLERGISAHYVLGRDGTLYQTVRNREQAWHAGVAALRGDSSPTVNARSIGIEIVNIGDGKQPFTEVQYLTLEQLVPWLAQKYDVPLENVVGHKDVALPEGRKIDPAANFDFARIRRAVRRAV